MKNELRKDYKKIRNDIKNKVKLSFQISDNLFNSEIYNNAESVFCYSSFGSEVDTTDIILNSLARNKTVALPVCKDKNGNMDFYKINSFSDLIEGAYGILEPNTNICEKINSTEKTLITVPAVIFDKKGYRIGYGKGYYDRYLKNFNGISVGLCYNECIVDEVPIGEFDQKVDFIDCENFLIKTE